MHETIVITDTSVLINFLVLDGVSLLAQLPGSRFVVTEHVRTEITEHHEEQLQRLEQAFADGFLEEIRVTDLAEVELFAKLTAMGLGAGECSTIVVAAYRRLAEVVTTDDAILNVALESGFQSLSRFNEAFKGTCGCSPRNYRKAHRSIK